VNRHGAVAEPFAVAALTSTDQGLTDAVRRTMVTATGGAHVVRALAPSHARDEM
jgi:hypothetical protein